MTFTNTNSRQPTRMPPVVRAASVVHCNTVRLLFFIGARPGFRFATRSISFAAPQQFKDGVKLRAELRG